MEQAQPQTTTATVKVEPMLDKEAIKAIKDNKIKQVKSNETIKK